MDAEWMVTEKGLWVQHAVLQNEKSYLLKPGRTITGFDGWALRGRSHFLCLCFPGSNRGDEKKTHKTVEEEQKAQQHRQMFHDTFRGLQVTAQWAQTISQHTSQKTGQFIATLFSKADTHFQFKFKEITNFAFLLQLIWTVNVNTWINRLNN